MAFRRSASLRRRLEAITRITVRTVSHRDYLRDKAKGARLIRVAALRAGIDPAQIRGLDRLAYTPSQLAERGVTPQSGRADAEFIAREPSRRPGWNWAAAVARRIPRFTRSPPRGPDATLDDWYAWALARAEKA